MYCIDCDKRVASGGGLPDPSLARVEDLHISIRNGVRGQVDGPTPKRNNINTDTVLDTPNVQANNVDVEHTACDLQDCMYCIEYGPNMEELAADLWNPMGGYLPARAADDHNTISHTTSECEILHAHPAELQSGEAHFTLRSHTSTLSHVGFSHAECSIVNLERAHTPRGRSQSAHSDRGPNGHLRQNDFAEL